MRSPNYGKKLHEKHPKEYRAWVHMKTRCSNPNYPMFHRYGGRGITVCDEWMSNFENFLRDMGESPSDEHSLERLDTDGNYDPSNCIWASQLDQQNNRGNNRIICIGGVEKTAAAWAREYGIAYLTFMRRIYLGWDVIDALTHKPGKSRYRYHTPEGVFSTQREVAQHYSMKAKTVSARFCSPNFPDWRKEPVMTRA